jgi:hypothetical protein
VRRAAVEQAEEREQAAPRGAAVAATLRSEAPELVLQSAEAVGLVVDGLSTGNSSRASAKRITTSRMTK